MDKKCLLVNKTPRYVAIERMTLVMVFKFSGSLKLAVCPSGGKATEMSPNRDVQRLKARR